MLLPTPPAGQEIYKYRPWNDHTRQLLESGSLFFACPKDFNDPFDTKVPPRLDGSDQDWLEWFMRVLPKRRMMSAPPALVAKEARRLVALGAHRDQAFLADRRADMVERQSRAGIVSLAVRRDNLILWAHYSDAHRGLCIGISFPSDSPLVPFLVHYGDCPVINIHDADYEDRVVRDCLLTKSREWGCEEECRLIVPDFHGPRQLPRSWFTSVIVGCRMIDEDRRAAVALVRRTNPQAKLLRAVPSTTEFALRFEVIDPEQGSA